MNEFCADFFELWHGYDLGDFSKYMYDAGIYPSVFYVMVGFILLPLVVYYVVLDHIQLARWWKWLFMIVFFSFANAVVGGMMAQNGVDSYLMQMNIHETSVTEAQVMSFALIDFAWCMVLSFVVSLLLQQASVKCRRIPF